MPHQITKASQPLVSVLNILIVISALSWTTAAQTTSATDGSTPLGLKPGAPAGSYSLSGFDNVNLYNGNLNFQLSLLHISGRGGAKMPVTLPIATKWRISDVAIPQFNGSVIHRYLPVQSWWENNERKYTPGSMAGRQSGLDEIECSDGTKVFGYSLTRLTFTSPDGTEFELRDQLTGGQPANNGLCNYLNPPSRGTIFVTSDGSAATFVSDATIYDQPISPNPGEIYPSGHLLLRDGTRYRIDNGLVSWVRDRNGNKLTFTYDSFNRVSTITDSLKRQVTITYNTGPGTSDQITYKGFGGASRSILVNYVSLTNALRSDYSGTSTYKTLFPESDGSSTTHHNPAVVASVTLPNGKQYQLKYSPYGELARVILPTGGAYEYDYAAGVTNDYASGITASGYQGSLVIYRRVTERRVYPDGGAGSAYSSRMTYSRPETTTTNAGYVIADQRNNTGTLLTRSKHYFFGSPRASFSISPIDYPGWKEGREYQTENFAANGTTILTRVTNAFQQRASVSWWSGSADLAPPNDVRLSETASTLVDTNQVSKQTFSYDDSVPFNNRSDVYEYDYGNGTTGPLIRRAHTDYLKTNPVNSTDYTTTTIHIRSLPTQVQVFDASGVEKSRSTFEYDNYVNDGDHAPLQARSNISGLDASFTTSYVTRGNQTRSTGWILATGTQLNSYSQFDVAGNVVKNIDARGHATLLEYDDRFGTPDTEAQGNTAPSALGGQTSYAFATRVANAAAHISYAQFDYYLGVAVNAQDTNGIVASGSHNDSLDRPTQIKRAIGSGAENQTTFEYDDTNRIVTTKNDRNTNGDNGLISKIVYDGLGRSIETRQYEGGSNCIVTLQQYDALGRAEKASNPYRPYLSETVVWTTTAFDGLGRTKSVTSPDSAVVSTAYSGNAVTVTDQAGKLRRSITDALGRLKRLDEPDASNNLDSGGSPVQPTYYSYDVLDNLTSVSQGIQTRTFVYDSLKRLTSATIPESGTVTYTYDANGNLTSKVDARTITTTMAYDVINRVTSKSYNDTPQTPTINYFYDTQTLPSGAPSFDRGFSTGRLVSVTYGSGGSAGTYRGYDQMGRVVRQYQRTDSVNYLVEATYYANSSLQTQTYPAVPGAGDRRVVTYTNDSAGRLSALSSTATSYGPGAGVSSIAYTAHNALKSETYGNTLIHSIEYNNRLQATLIKLGTSGNPTSVVSLGYGYGTTNNNGNVLTHSYSGGGLSYTQNFGYDALNRLTTSSENSGSGWSQTNGYDRYGNRWVSLGGGSQSLYFNTSNNRITGGSYDAVGNLLNDSSHAYTYDAENKIAKVDNVVAYTYDGEGKRVRKHLGGNLRFVYSISGQLIAEFSGSNGSLLKEYVHGNGLLATIEPSAVNANGTRYTTSDHLGSPRVVTTATAGVLSRHDYMPYGVELNSGVGGRTTGMGFPGPSDGIRKKFTGYERDYETGLDFAQARYFHSVQGRFISVDPLAASATGNDPQTWNRYVFALNNPLRFVDPTGLAPDDYYAAADGTITIFETEGTLDVFYVESLSSAGTFTYAGQANRNAAGLVQFPASGTGFNRYGMVDAGGTSRAGEVVGAGDHYVQPIVAAGLYGMVNVLSNLAQPLTMSFGDMSSSNGSDPWQAGQSHHSGHGHDGNRSGQDIDFRYLNTNGVSFQSPTATTDSQFSAANNQTVYDTARRFGFAANYSGTNGPSMNNASPARGHNDHGHIGFDPARATVIRHSLQTQRDGTRTWTRVP